jgi:hypothetical protein
LGARVLGEEQSRRTICVVDDDRVLLCWVLNF